MKSDVLGTGRRALSLLGRTYACCTRGSSRDGAVCGRKAPLLGRDEALLSNTFVSPGNGSEACACVVF